MLKMFTERTSYPKEPQPYKTSGFLNQRCWYPLFRMGNTTFVVWELPCKNKEQKFFKYFKTHCAYVPSDRLQLHLDQDENLDYSKSSHDEASSEAFLRP